MDKADTPRKRCRRWAQSSVRKRLFEAVQEPDVNWGLLGSTIGRAHAQTAGSHKKPPRRGAPGRSHGELTTSIDALVGDLDLGKP